MFRTNVEPGGAWPKSRPHSPNSSTKRERESAISSKVFGTTFRLKICLRVRGSRNGMYGWLLHDARCEYGALSQLKSLRFCRFQREANAPCELLFHWNQANRVVDRASTLVLHCGFVFVQ